MSTERAGGRRPSIVRQRSPQELAAALAAMAAETSDPPRHARTVQSAAGGWMDDRTAAGVPGSPPSAEQPGLPPMPDEPGLPPMPDEPGLPPPAQEAEHAPAVRQPRAGGLAPSNGLTSPSGRGTGPRPSSGLVIGSVASAAAVGPKRRGRATAPAGSMRGRLAAGASAGNRRSGTRAGAGGSLRRLTRRQWLLVAIVMAFLLLLVVLIAGGGSSPKSRGSTPSAARVAASHPASDLTIPPPRPLLVAPRLAPAHRRPLTRASRVRAGKRPVGRPVHRRQARRLERRARRG